MKLLFPVLMLSLLVSVPAFADRDEMGMMGGHGEPGRCGSHGEMMGMGDHEPGAHMGMMGDMMHMCLHHGERLGLSDQQMAKIKAIHRNLERNKIRLAADKSLAEMDLREITDIKDFDLDRASAVVQQIARLKTEIHLEMLKAMKGVRSVLSDEQFKKMKGMMGDMGCHHAPGERMM